MNNPLLLKRTYWFLFSLLGLVYIIGLFVTLMDNDSAHHANIALRMYLTGDYVNLIDNGKDYLDKPHLHFWLCAFSYKIFGVTTFAYKFPSFLFTILGTYSTYRLGKRLYSEEVGRLAALIVASAFAYILADNDVRMDAILTASIVFAIWQLVEFADNKKIINVAGAALGLALGFCTKGHIAVFTPAVAVFFYILYRKDWRLFYNIKWLLLIALFFIFISPVVYCYYLQYDMHPEKMVRGRSNISGVNFILWNQSIERFKGDSFGSDAKNDYFFFIHSFLWAFAPWSILAYLAFVGKLKNFRRTEWLTVGVFLVMMIVISLSGFKLPHYLNIILPVSAVMTAGLLESKKIHPGWGRRIFILQVTVCFLLLILSAIINVWAFPVKNFIVGIVLLLLLSVIFYFYIHNQFSYLQKSISISVATMAFTFFLLNSNFYPQLLHYQAGNELAKKVKGKIEPADIYFWDEVYSSSFCFYTKTLRQPFSDSILQKRKIAWLIFSEDKIKEITARGYSINWQYSSLDYEITRLSLPFMDPDKRVKHCTHMFIAEISKTGY